MMVHFVGLTKWHLEAMRIGIFRGAGMRVTYTAVLGKKIGRIGWRPLWGLRPSHLGNPGSATVT